MKCEKTLKIRKSLTMWGAQGAPYGNQNRPKTTSGTVQSYAQNLGTIGLTVRISIRNVHTHGIVRLEIDSIIKLIKIISCCGQKKRFSAKIF